MVTWEHQKENAAPISRGRCVSVLEHEMSESEKQRTVETFEQALSNSDVMTWIRYLKWFQEYCPTDTHGSFLLLERCFQTFLSDESLSNDPRYIRVCCLYAEKTREPEITFQEIYRAGIGHTSAVFWNAWAFVAEKSQNFRLAEKIFVKGLQKRAQPVEYLLLRQKRFQRRMSRYFIDSIDAAPDDIDDQRSALTSISRADVSANDRRGHQTVRGHSSRAAATRPAMENHNNGVAPFSVYHEDGNSDDGFSFLDASVEHVPRRETEFERWKENKAKTEKWNDRQHGPVVPRVTTTGSFSIHIDDQCAQEIARKDLELQQRERQHRETRDERQDKNQKRKFRPMWNKGLLIGPNHDEQCFEEARAARKYYRLAPESSNVNVLASNHDSSDMSLSLETCDGDGIDVRRPQNLQILGGNLMSRFDEESYPLPTPRNQSTVAALNGSNCSSVVDERIRAPTEPTINSLFARKEISMMFSSPAVANGGERSGIGSEILNRSTDVLLQNSIIVHDESVQQENKDAPTNPNARANDIPGFDGIVLQNLEQDTGTRTGCSAPNVAQLDQSNPLRGLQVHDIEPNPGFVVFEDEQPIHSTFSIFLDDEASPEFGDISRIDHEDTTQFPPPRR